jgi:hypothetical protein
MKSFRLEKTSGNADVTHEALLWLLVLTFVVAPVLGIVWYILG